MPIVLVFVLKWVKCVLRCSLHKFHLSGAYIGKTMLIYSVECDTLWLANRRI